MVYINGQEKINPRDSCYQCSKNIPEFLFVNLRVRDYRDELHFPAKIKSLSSQIQINILFKNNDEINIMMCDRNIHKAMTILVNIYKKIVRSI